MSAAKVVLGRASRPRWLARRRKGLTATDVPALLGLSPWSTPLDVWLEKLDPRPWAGTYATRRGQRLESFIAAEYAAEHDLRLERPPALVAHPDHPWLLCSLDFYAHAADGATTVLECKAVGRWSPEWADDDLPDVYAVQALTQAAITGLPVTVVADIGGRLEDRRIEPDPAWEADTIPTLDAWWRRHIIGRTPPPLDPHRDYVHLSRLWVPDPGATVEATDAVMGAVQVAAKLRAEVDILDRLVTAARTQIRAYMGTATRLTAPDSDQTVAKVNRRGALTVTYTPPTEGSTAA